MSDREAFGSAVDDELSLPKATVSKMISGEFHFTTDAGGVAERLDHQNSCPTMSHAQRKRETWSLNVV
jgi:hypothetical protein